MKTPILIAAAFLVGLVGSTAASRVLLPPAHAASDSTAHAPADSAAHDPAAPAHMPAPSDTAAAATHDTSVTAIPHDPPPAATATPAAAVTPPPASGAGTTESHRIAGIVRNLPAADAGALITVLDDDVAVAVLRELGLERAAAILATLPDARSAALGRRLITGLPASGRP